MDVIRKWWGRLWETWRNIEFLLVFCLFWLSCVSVFVLVEIYIYKHAYTFVSIILADLCEIHSDFWFGIFSCWVFVFVVSLIVMLILMCELFDFCFVFSYMVWVFWNFDVWGIVRLRWIKWFFMFLCLTLLFVCCSLHLLILWKCWIFVDVSVTCWDFLLCL